MVIKQVLKDCGHCGHFDTSRGAVDPPDFQLINIPP